MNVLGIRITSIFFIFSIIPALSVFGDDKTETPATSHNAPDYSMNASWSIIGDTTDKEYDVFFVHPTTYGNTDFGLNAPIDNAKLNKETDITVNKLTSVFEESCNIYAPRYRQVSIDVMRMDEKKKNYLLAMAAADVRKAFNYYLEHYNNGRPFIIAAHSQGSNVTQLILKKSPHLIDKKKLIGAYLVGWTFTDNDIQQMDIPLATSPEQTGGLLTWNTVGKEGKSPTVLPGARCVNPLNWSINPTEAPAALNVCAVIELANGSITRIQHFTSAKINDEGALEIPTPAIVDKLNMRMGKGIYHRYDYDFFHDNIMQNVKLRCEAWRKKTSKTDK